MALAALVCISIAESSLGLSSNVSSKTGSFPSSESIADRKPASWIICEISRRVCDEGAAGGGGSSSSSFSPSLSWASSTDAALLPAKMTGTEGVEGWFNLLEQ